MIDRRGIFGVMLGGLASFFGYEEKDYWIWDGQKRGYWLKEPLEWTNPKGEKFKGGMIYLYKCSMDWPTIDSNGRQVIYDYYGEYLVSIGEKGYQLTPTINTKKELVAVLKTEDEVKVLCSKDVRIAREYEKATGKSACKWTEL